MSVLEPFRPARWLPGPHLQTLGGRFLRRLETVPMRSHRLELPDGDFVDLHEADVGLPPDAPAAVVLHGLEGSARANYVATLARELAALGIRAVRLNFRGCSGEMNRLTRFYHAGETGDLQQVIRHLREQAPDRPLGAVGFSLGGNVLLKYLGERGDEARNELAGAAVVSVPFDLSAGTRRLEQPGMSRLYTLYFMRKLRRKVAAKRARLAEVCDLDRLARARTIREYDDALTAPLHGFSDAWDYYSRCSAAGWLEHIRLPTLVLHALDDPFLPETAVPLERIDANPWLVNGVHRAGGHVGFVTGPPWKPGYWAERQAARFLAGALRRENQRSQPSTRGASH